ncbi:MAG: hypothetical protein KAJ01_05990, partial [Candidatus Hydrogenedentes bacterium]|nr:hypothetical protein [Candidatus Hydrogenedentota bacterium]
AWEDMVSLWTTVTTMHEISQWSIGDAYLLAEELFGEDASQLPNPRGAKYKTVQNYAWVCRRFHDRRWRRSVDVLSFSHHAAVAGLMDESKDREWALQLLAKAVKEEITVDDVEAEVRKYRGVETPPAEEEEVSFSIGPPLARMERINNGINNLIKDLPADWSEEAHILGEAQNLVADAMSSAKNRQAGGEPALVAEG